jgi:hypothetical protein
MPRRALVEHGTRRSVATHDDGGTPAHRRDFTLRSGCTRIAIEPAETTDFVGNTLEINPFKEFLAILSLQEMAHAGR